MTRQKHSQNKFRNIICNDRMDIAYSMITAFVVMLFCTRSSFLYAFNNWDDANSYFSMGKAIMNGMVPYRDLFDQKGMLLYVLYGIGYLISRRSFTGIFIIEVLMAGMTALAMLKTAQLYIRRTSSWLLTLPVLAAVCASRAFWWGGSAEEMMLPFLSWGLFLQIRYFKKSYPQPAGYRLVLTGGLLAGCVANIKFNSLGFFFAWMAMIFLADLLVKEVRRAFVSCVVFLGGMGIATLPWLIYFALHHAVKEWLYVYLYLNAFLYSEKLPLLQRLYRMCKTIYFHFDYNTTWFVIMIFGGLWYLIRKGKWIEKLNLLCLGAFLILGIFIGGVNLPYYVLPLGCFAVLGVIPAGELLEWMTEKIKMRSPAGRRKCTVLIAGMLVSVLLTTGIICRNSQNLSFMKYRKADLWQYRFAEIVDNSGVKDPTLLNMGCFDAGLYTVTGIVPTCYYYQTQTIHLSNVETTQYNAMWQGVTDFIVTRELEPLGVEKHYDLVAEQKWKQSGTEYTYRLYQKVR